MKIYALACYIDQGDDMILEMSTNKQDMVTSYYKIRESFAQRKLERYFDENYHIKELEVTENTGIFWNSEI